MSDFEKNKDGRRRRYYNSQRERDAPNYSNNRRGIYKYDTQKESNRSSTDLKESIQPTILLKTRDNAQPRPPSPKRVPKEVEPSQPKQIQKPKPPPVDIANTLGNPPFMDHSVQLIDENFAFIEELQEYLQDNSSDFLVVGVIGTQGVGKSMIMNLLTDDHKVSTIPDRTSSVSSVPEMKLVSEIEMDMKNLTEEISCLNLGKTEYFKTQSIQDLERGIHSTNGINVYITPNRMILLDSQPILSASNLDDMIQTGSSATAAGEIISTENSSEIQSLQLAAILLTVCHVVILVQDWFFDPNVIRFIQAAEMLKPSLTTAGEEELNDHSPHLIVVHNRARVEDFNPPQFKIIQDTYRQLFNKSKLKIDTGLGIATGNIHHSLSPLSCGDPLNIFLIPDIDPDDQNLIYRGYPKIEELVRRLKANIQGAARSQLTHSQLSEKAWLYYASKAWEGVKKSSFFVEYNKLLT